MDAGLAVTLVLLLIVVLAAGATVLILVLKTPKGAEVTQAGPPQAVPPPINTAAEQPRTSLPVKDTFVPEARRELKNRYETPEFVILWETNLANLTAEQTLENAKKMGALAELCWKTYTEHGFAHSPLALKWSGQDRYRKLVYLSGCCLRFPDYDGVHDYLGRYGDQSYIMASGEGTLGHELGHLRQLSSGGFANPLPGINTGWAWESSANYMSILPELKGNLPDGNHLKKWGDDHFLSLELWDSVNGYPYSSWPFWLWIDKTFGKGMVGRMWSESKRDAIGSCGEAVPECLARLVKLPLADVFGKWVAATLVFSYFNDPKGEPRYIELANNFIKTELKSTWWSYFDAVEIRVSRVIGKSAKPLQPFGFHALKLDSTLKGKRLRLETTVDPPSWRMVVIPMDVAKQQILTAGETSEPLGPEGGIVGIISTTRSTLPAENAYFITLS